MSSNVITESAAMTPQQAARIVKEARLRKPLTQKELAELAGISLRSIQRIENSEFLPRAYTLRLLEAHIDLQLELLPPLSTPENNMHAPKLNLPRKWIISIAALVVIVLAFSAFVIQSPTFPETLFETINMITAGCVLYALLLYKIWG